MNTPGWGSPALASLHSPCHLYSRNPQSAVRRPPSAIHNPQSAVLQPETRTKRFNRGNNERGGGRWVGGIWRGGCLWKHAPIVAFIITTPANTNNDENCCRNIENAAYLVWIGALFAGSKVALCISDCISVPRVCVRVCVRVPDMPPYKLSNKRWQQKQSAAD